MTHAKTEFDPNEQTAARYRLFARAIEVIGLQQIAALQPTLLSSLEQTVTRAMRYHHEVDGIWKLFTPFLCAKGLIPHRLGHSRACTAYARCCFRDVRSLSIRRAIKLAQNDTSDLTSMLTAR